MYLWRELELGEVGVDFAHMQDLGIRTVRAFLVAEDFLSAPMRAQRQALVLEFGICTAPLGKPSVTIIDDFLGRPRLQFLASEEEAALYYERVLERLVATGASGASAWCYGDSDPQLLGVGAFRYSRSRMVFWGWYGQTEARNPLVRRFETAQPEWSEKTWELARLVRSAR